MNIAVLFSGYLRCFNETINSLKDNLLDNNCDIYLHYSKNSNETKYYNKDISIENIEKLIPLKSIIYSDNLLLSNNSKENNTLNQNYKLYILNQHIKTISTIQNIKYNIVVKIRPDIFLKTKIDFSLVKKNILYIPKDSKIDKSKLINPNDKSICDTIAYGDYNTMNIYLNFFKHNKEFIKKYGYVNETILYYYLKQCNINIQEVDIEYYIILSKCNTIAITGDSGTGKTTLSRIIESLYSSSIILECDRYHKWERNNINWKKYTHLNPNANYITKMKNDVFNLKLGQNIYQVNYNHTTGKFTDKEIIESKENIIVCGLHSNYLNNDIVNLKIYLDTDQNLRIFWKIKRDMKKRGYSKEKVYQQIIERNYDYNKYILPQKYNSDLIINIYSDNYIFDIDKYNENINHNIKFKIGINIKYNINLIIKHFNNCDFKKINNYLYLNFDNIKLYSSVITNLLRIL